MVKIKQKDFISTAPVMPFQNSSWIIGLEDLWRRESPDFPEFTCYDRSCGKDPG